MLEITKDYINHSNTDKLFLNTNEYKFRFPAMPNNYMDLDPGELKLNLMGAVNISGIQQFNINFGTDSSRYFLIMGALVFNYGTERFFRINSGADGGGLHFKDVIDGTDFYLSRGICTLKNSYIKINHDGSNEFSITNYKNNDQAIIRTNDFIMDSNRIHLNIRNNENYLSWLRLNTDNLEIRTGNSTNYGILQISDRNFYINTVPPEGGSFNRFTFEVNSYNLLYSTTNRYFCITETTFNINNELISGGDYLLQYQKKYNNTIYHLVFSLDEEGPYIQYETLDENEQVIPNEKCRMYNFDVRGINYVDNIGNDKINLDFKLLRKTLEFDASVIVLKNIDISQATEIEVPSTGTITIANGHISTTVNSNFEYFDFVTKSYTDSEYVKKSDYNQLVDWYNNLVEDYNQFKQQVTEYMNQHQ